MCLDGSVALLLGVLPFLGFAILCDVSFDHRPGCADDAAEQYCQDYQRRSDRPSVLAYELSKPVAHAWRNCSHRFARKVALNVKREAIYGLIAPGAVFL